MEKSPPKRTSLFDTKKYDCLSLSNLKRSYLLQRLYQYNSKLKQAQTERNYPKIHDLQLKTKLLKEVIFLYTHPLD